MRIDDQVRNTVQATMDRMVAGYARRDIDMVMGCYEPQAVYALEPGESAFGTGELLDLFRKLISMDPQFRFVGEEIVLTEDLALHISAYDAQRPGGVVHRGLSVAVLRRQATGEWLMIMDHPAAQRLLGLHPNMSA